MVEAPDCSLEQGLRVSSQKEGLLGTCPADDRASLSWIHTFQALNAGFIRFFLGGVEYRHRQALSLGKQAQRCEVICLHHVRAPLRPTLCSEDPALGHV